MLSDTALSVLLDEASRGRTESDDQIGRSLRVERPEIFDKFGFSGIVAIQSRDEGLLLNVQRPRRLLVQLSADFSAPCSPLLEIRAERYEGAEFFLAEREARQDLG